MKKTVVKAEQAISEEEQNEALPFDVEQPDETKHLNIIIYADSGVGKTHLAGTAEAYEETSPALFIDFEGGTTTLRGQGMKVDVVRPTTITQLQDVYRWLLFKNTKYKSVILDPLTELQKKQSMGAIMGDISSDVQGYLDLEKSVAATRQDWLRTGEQMRKIIRAFRDLAYLPDRNRRVHVIMTALEKYDEKKDTVSPQLPGSLGTECGAMVDILVRLSKVSVIPEGEENPVVRRYLLCEDYINEEGKKFMAKNRGSKLGKGLWDPTIEKIIGAWRSNES